LQLEDWERARDAFFAALALDPEDETARFNLEWTLAAMRGDADAPTPGDTASPTPPSDDPEPEADGSESESTGEASAPSGGEPALDEAARRAWLDRIHEEPGDWLRGGGAPPGSAPSPNSVPVW